MKALLWIVVAAACGSSIPAPAPAPAPVTPAPAPVVHSDLPATPAGRQLQWVFDGLNKPATVDNKAIGEHFATSFTDKVPPAQVIAVFNQMSELLAAMKLGEIENKAPSSLVVHVATPNQGFIFLISTDETGKIAGLLVQPEQVKSYDEVLAKLDKHAAQNQMLVAELDHGTCKSLHEHNATAELAIGSTLKLYVLIALADQIAAGKLTWEQELAVRDDWKSLPSGITQDDKAGTKMSVKTLAERMISISDNTATDHLLYTVGRDRVEAALKTAKHSDPKRDIPYLSTRELFWLKLGMTPDEVTAYKQLDAAKRRKFLDSIAGKHPPIEHAEEWKLPRDIDTLEWFASSNDLCNAMAALQVRSQTPANKALLDVLGKNPGMPQAAGWKFIGFKGGSEPGVLNATWLLQRDDDRWFVVTIGMNDTTKAIGDENVALGQSLIALLAKER